MNKRLYVQKLYLKSGAAFLIFIGIKSVAGIELIVILTVAALNLTIVARSIRTNELVAYTECGSGCLEQSWFVL